LLPETAPRIRITIGAGTEWQESICLRRPMTVVGSDRPSCVRLNGPLIARIHFAIVNSGNVVMLKDLHTPDGTFRNGERVDLAVLHDGDVVSVDDAPVQIAIKRLAGLGAPVVEPANPPPPSQALTLATGNRSRMWTVDRNCMLIGSSASAEISLDDPTVMPIHAMLFMVGQDWVLYDLSGDMSCSVDGKPIESSILWPGAILSIGKHEFEVGEPGVVAPSAVSLPVAAASGNSQALAHTPAVVASESAPATRKTQDSLSEVEHRLAALREEIEASWKRINDTTSSNGRAKAGGCPGEPAKSTEAKQPANETETVPCDTAGEEYSERELLRKAEMDAREAELEQRDADLRGRLCDLNTLSEELAQRERELRTQQQNLESEMVRLQNRAQQHEQRELVLQTWQKRLETREKKVAACEEEIREAEAAQKAESNGFEFAPRRCGLFWRKTRVGS
jgi:pSer/pThr/pTyr-binding forkhead associated (FHA) protein